MHPRVSEGGRRLLKSLGNKTRVSSELVGAGEAPNRHDVGASEATNRHRRLHRFGLALKQFHLYDEALALFQRAFSGLEHCVGPDNPRTLLALKDLARVHEKMGNHDHALTLYRQVLRGQELNHEPTHDNVLATVNLLAGLHKKLGAFDKALELFTRALAG